MLVPLSWLKEYVDINDIAPSVLEEKLFSCGFEVEEVIEIGKDISGVVVGLVKECEPIPDTHLHVCKVDVGQPELLQICCGADNVVAGKKFPVALDGASCADHGADLLIEIIVADLYRGIAGVGGKSRFDDRVVIDDGILDDGSCADTDVLADDRVRDVRERLDDSRTLDAGGTVDYHVVLDLTALADADIAD